MAWIAIMAGALVPSVVVVGLAMWGGGDATAGGHDQPGDVSTHEQPQSPAGMHTLAVSTHAQRAPADPSTQAESDTMSDPGAQTWKKQTQASDNDADAGDDNPPRTPAEALESFQVVQGFEVQLVAAEPLVVDPVAMDFDARGRLWVAEMTTYMTPNIHAEGEAQPKGRVVVLSDTDGDGRMDKRRVFMDGLVLPRTITVLGESVIVGAPPNLWECRDTDGDGEADQRTLISDHYGTPPGEGNPEHKPNGMLRAMDNWFYNAKSAMRYRKDADGWHAEKTTFRGQWGITQDDLGRLYYTNNSNLLLGDYAYPGYYQRNPDYPHHPGIDEHLIRDQTVWPAIPSYVNRGYKPHMLRDDGTLSRTTGVSGPVIYRGNQFPDTFRGNAFSPEPAGNLIKRMIREAEPDRFVTRARQAYKGREFLTSTDHRFRPVNLYNGPDGTLYVVDMYRGVFQHRTYLTDYLEKQSRIHGLENEPQHTGRIYRIVSTAKPTHAGPDLASMDDDQLVKQLTSDNGWTRDHAQHLLIDRGGSDAAPALEAMSTDTGTPALARVHALWTLQGLGQMRPAIAAAALNDPDPRVRRQGLRLLEPWLQKDDDAALGRAIKATHDRAEAVRIQAMFSLGESDTPRARAAMADLVKREGESRYIRGAALSGLHGKELAFMQRLMSDPAWADKPSSAAVAMFNDLAGCALRGPRPRALFAWLATLRGRQGWVRHSVLTTLADAVDPDEKPRALDATPTPLMTLADGSGPDAALAKTLLSGLTWPDKAKAGAKPELTPAQTKLIAQGQNLYVTCAACHQPDGKGMANIAPALDGSPWVNGKPEVMLKVMLGGLQGPVRVKGEQLDSVMPSHAYLDDQQIASIASYVRQAWGNTADPVDPAQVKQLREKYADHGAWTTKELKPAK